MTRLFHREVELTIARPVQGTFFKNQPNAVVIKDLRVSFSVEKHLGKEPNPCRISVYNLSENTRAELQTKPLHIRLEAGYDGETQRIFHGDLIWTDTKVQNASLITSLEVADGARAFKHARVNRSFKAGIDTKTALRETAKSMGLSLPTNVEEARELASQFASGLSLQGPSSREMTRLLKPHGMNWSIQDGRLQILKGDQSREGQALIISPDTGLVGTPEFGAPPQSKEPPTLRFRMLLFPELTPGGKIIVQSKPVQGLFRLEKVLHLGDTRGKEWYSDCEARPL